MDLHHKKYANSPCDICDKPTRPTELHIQWDHKEEEWIWVCPDCGTPTGYSPLRILLRSALTQDTNLKKETSTSPSRQNYLRLLDKDFSPIKEKQL